MSLVKSTLAIAGILAVNSAFAAIACSPANGTKTFTAGVTSEAEASSCAQNTTMGVFPATIGGPSGVSNWQQGTAAGIAIFGLSLGAGNTGVTVSVDAGSSFIPEVLVAGPAATCQDTDPYIGDSTAAAVGGASGAVTLANASPAGQYWVFVGDISGGAGDAGCGTFALTVSGTLPVKLQEFSVQ